MGDKDGLLCRDLVQVRLFDFAVFIEKRLVVSKAQQPLVRGELIVLAVLNQFVQYDRHGDAGPVVVAVMLQVGPAPHHGGPAKVAVRVDKAGENGAAAHIYFFCVGTGHQKQVFAGAHCGDLPVCHGHGSGSWETVVHCHHIGVIVQGVDFHKIAPPSALKSKLYVSERTVIRHFRRARVR